MEYHIAIKVDYRKYLFVIRSFYIAMLGLKGNKPKSISDLSTPIFPIYLSVSYYLSTTNLYNL